VKLPQQELGASFDYKRKTNLSPSGCRYISRQESGVLCGIDLWLNYFLKNIRKKKSDLITSCEYLKLKEADSLNY